MSVGLDKYQRTAVYSKEERLLVVAAPGSGKTTVIINRVDYLINNLNITPENIIVITFTRAAAANMKSRYLNMANKKSAPFFGTFHGLFYKILRRHFGEINIINTGEAHSVIKKVLLTYLDEISEEKVKEVLDSISQYKCGQCTMEEFIPDMDKTIFMNCYSYYEEYKKNKNELDFDDLQIKCRDLFRRNYGILQSYQRLFKYMLVDEFQDCDAIQIEILQMLTQGNCLFAVGDEDQCIYTFRGSKPECMVNFDKYFVNGKKLYLSYNYRSPQNIIKMSKELINNNKQRNNKEILSAKDNETDVKVLYNFNESIQAEEIAKNIEIMKEGLRCRYSDNSILYRTNLESRSIVDAFIRRKIPFKLLDKEYNFFHHFICKDLLAYLALSIDRTDRQSFLRIINKPFRYVSKLNIEKLKAHRFKEDCFDFLCSIEAIPVFQIKMLKELKQDIYYLNKSAPRIAIDTVVSALGYRDYIKEYSNKFKLNSDELWEIVEEFKEACSQFDTAVKFLEHVKEVEAKVKSNVEQEETDSVILSTIHGVKGMEFKNVFIINCVEDYLPHSNSLPQGIEEERRLMYVAVTRTIENLFISIPKTVRGKTKEVSRFIKECNLPYYTALTMGFEAGEQIIHSAFGEGEIIEIREDEINIKFQDGICRRFNTEIVVNNRLIEKKKD